LRKPDISGCRKDIFIVSGKCKKFFFLQNLEPFCHNEIERMAGVKNNGLLDVLAVVNWFSYFFKNSSRPSLPLME